MKSSVSSVDLFQHVSMQMKVLDFFGLSFCIPYSEKSVKFWLRILFRICVGLLVFVVPTLAQIVYLIRLILTGKAKIQEIASILNLILTEILTSSKLLDMCLRRASFQVMIDQLNSEEFSYSWKPLQVLLSKAVRVSRILFIAFLSSSTITVSFHVLVVPGLQSFKILPVKMDFVFFDLNDPKYNKYVYAYQILYKPWMIVAFVAIKTLPWAAMKFTVSQLDVLIYNFENMKELVNITKDEQCCDENEAFRQIFKRFVLHYSAIKRFTNTLQTVFSTQLFFTLFVSTGIIGTTAMQFLSIESPRDNVTEVLWVLIFINICIWMIFADSYFANSITMKSEYLSAVVYSTAWTNLKLSLKKDILIFLAYTQQPIVITAAGLIPVSLETFTKVMNWTYKGFAVMNQMK